MGERECQTQRISQKGSQMHLILCNGSQNWHLFVLKILKRFFPSHLFRGIPPLPPFFSLKAKNLLSDLHPPSQGLTCMQERADLEDKIELDLSKLVFFSDDLADYLVWSQKIVHWEHFSYWFTGKQGGVLLFKREFLVELLHTVVCSLDQQKFLGLFMFPTSIVSSI